MAATARMGKAAPWDPTSPAPPRLALARGRKRSSLPRCSKAVGCPWLTAASTPCAPTCPGTHVSPPCKWPISSRISGRSPAIPFSVARHPVTEIGDGREVWLGSGKFAHRDDWPPDHSGLSRESGECFRTERPPASARRALEDRRGTPARRRGTAPSLTTDAQRRPSLLARPALRPTLQAVGVHEVMRAGSNAPASKSAPFMAAYTPAGGFSRGTRGRPRRTRRPR
jgi:hypothetical protein